MRGMNIQIDTLAYTNRLRQLPPEQKLIFALTVELIALIAHAPTQLLIVLWMGVWTVGYAGIPARVYLRLIALACVFLFMSLPALVINIVSTAQMDLVQADQWLGLSLGSWNFYISRSGSEQALAIVVRSLACVSCLFFCPVYRSVYRTVTDNATAWGTSTSHRTASINVPLRVYPPENSLRVEVSTAGTRRRSHLGQSHTQFQPAGWATIQAYPRALSSIFSWCSSTRLYR